MKNQEVEYQDGKAFILKGGDNTYTVTEAIHVKNEVYDNSGCYIAEGFKSAFAAYVFCRENNIQVIN